jgi:hypothetical protein
MWLITIGIICMAIFIPDQPLVSRLFLIITAVLMLLIIPDMKAVYGSDGIILTFGVKGIWKKRIARGDITRVSIAKFNPMKHFNGWGIRYGRREFVGVLMWAMPTREPRGILVETAKGRKFLIGDEDPETTLTLLASVYPVDTSAEFK